MNVSWEITPIVIMNLAFQSPFVQHMTTEICQILFPALSERKDGESYRTWGGGRGLKWINHTCHRERTTMSKINIEQKSERKTCEGGLVKASKGWLDPDFAKPKCGFQRVIYCITCTWSLFVPHLTDRVALVHLYEKIVIIFQALDPLICRICFI